MYEAIKNFSAQFLFEPKIENETELPAATHFVVAGMGGSHLAADLINIRIPELKLAVHHDYGLPLFDKDAYKENLFIASSYSGNTEETLDSYEKARAQEYAVAAISTGGKLLDYARRDRVPFIQLPDTGIQPRAALGFSTRALLKLFREDSALHETRSLGEHLKPEEFEEQGKALAERLRGKIPLIYTSRRNAPLGYAWKIKFNETAKIPAFCNNFPELSHNEMTGFDRAASTRDLSERMCVIMLKDARDGERVQKRMDITATMLRERGVSVEALTLKEGIGFYTIFSTLLIADWTSYYTALYYGVEPEEVPMVEELKKRITLHGTDTN